MEQRTSEGIEWSVDAAGIARIVLDRAGRPNTISLPAAKALARAVDDVASAAPRVVLLTGRGSVFCAGGDITEFRDNLGSLAQLVDDILRPLHPAVATLSQLPAPVVTAINGSVGGAGIGLALCGDFALGSASMKLRTGYAAIGLSPDAGTSYFLTRRIGSLRARQAFFTSDAIDAQHCLDWGIVDSLHPDAELQSAAEALCQRLAAAAPGSMAAIKRLCDGAAQRSLAEHLALEKTLLEARANGANAREGIEAFLQRRTPNFQAE